MKATYATLQTDIMNFEHLQDQYENEPHRFNGLGKKELAKRIKLIEDIKEMVNG